MPAPPKVLELVERFNRNSDEYRAPDFKEANVRVQFIDPLFRLLGWDMENERGHAEAYREVIHEASLKIGGATKAPECSEHVESGNMQLLPAMNGAMSR